MTGRLEVATRAVERRHAALVQTAGERLALSPREVIGLFVRQPDPAAVEKHVDAFEPRTPVDECPVVGTAVEGNEMHPRLLGEAQQELVEDLGPGPGVQDAHCR